MSAIGAITALREMGYMVELKDDYTIKLSWQGDGKPDKDKASPLIKNLNTSKRKAVDYLSKSRYLEAVFQEALDRVNDRYAKNPDLLGEYDAESGNECTDRIETLWQGCLEGRVAEYTFRQAVADWEEVVLPRVIRSFS